MTHKLITDAIIHLLNTEPFYANFLFQCRIRVDGNVSGIRTAAVFVERDMPVICINPDYVSEYGCETVAAILKHEVLHLVHHHTVTVMEEGKDPYIANIAMDCAINQHISHLPEDAISLKSLKHYLGNVLDPLESSDYYYDRLLKHKELLQRAGFVTMDDHDAPSEEEAGPEVAKGVIARAARDAVKRSCGNVPDHVLETLGDLDSAKLPWSTILRNTVMTNIIRKTKTTYKRLNRRFDLPVPGKVHKREFTLGVCVDESGSISDSDHAKFMSEVKSISKLITKTWLVHADCNVAHVEQITGSNFKPTRRASGSTAYQPAIDKCLELKCNMIVYFGDFDSSDVPVNPGVPFIWVGVGRSKPPADFGKVIKL